MQKKIYLFILLTVVWFKGFAVGEIAFVAFQSDNPDTFSWVSLVPIPEGQNILFTDKGWTGSAFRLSEGEDPIIWVAPARGIAAGTVVTISTDGTVFSATIGSISSGAVNLSTDGDQLFAFTGSVGSPNFITGINFGGSDWTYLDNTNTSALPATLTNGVNSLAVGNFDNGRYNCTGGTLMGNATTMSTTIYTLTNWTTSNPVLSPAISTCTYMSSSLPVGLISFKSEAQLTGIELTWQTGEETDNSHFEVEKSPDAQYFEAIGRVSGKGNSSVKQVYSYFDASPKNGSNYYRLKQIDFDGKFEYSRIVSTRFTGAGIFKVYPNPVSSELNIELPGEAKMESAFLYDLLGRKVKEFSTHALQLEGIDNGIYFLHVLTKDGRSFRERILKMN